MAEFDSTDQAKAAFEALKEGGEVSMKIQETFWSKCFGSLTDKFGISWNISIECPTEKNRGIFMENVSKEQIQHFRLHTHHLDTWYQKSDVEGIAGACGFQNSPPGAIPKKEIQNLGERFALFQQLKLNKITFLT